MSASDRLQRIEDAICESILRASPEELREELKLQGLDEAKVIAEMDAILAEAVKACNKTQVYDPAADFAGSLRDGYEAIRQRMANGGKGWEP